jgi:hypothetical protein
VAKVSCMHCAENRNQGTGLSPRRIFSLSVAAMSALYLAGVTWTVPWG